MTMCEENLSTGEVLPYDKAREFIQNGDLISFRPNDNNFLHRLTLKVTNSEFYHSGMAVWMTSPGGIERLFVCEAQRSGRRLVPLSLYDRNSFDVVASPVPFFRMEEGLLSKVGSVRYGFMDFVAVGARNIFGVQMADFNGEICSEMVQDRYADGGAFMPSYPLAPGELQQYLIEQLGCCIRVRVRP